MMDTKEYIRICNILVNNDLSEFNRVVEFLETYGISVKDDDNSGFSVSSKLSILDPLIEYCTENMSKCIFVYAIDSSLSVFIFEVSVDHYDEKYYLIFDI